MKRAWVTIGIAFCALMSAASAQESGERPALLPVKLVITCAEFLPDCEEVVAAVEQEVKVNPAMDSDEMAERLRDQFQQRGYFKALVSKPETTISSTGPHRLMVVKTHVDAGQQFRLDQIEFSGNTIFHSNELSRAIPMNDGDVFDVEKIRQGIKALRDLYGSGGYINFTPVPDTRIDDYKQLITVVFDCDEGDQFWFGTLSFKGLEPHPGTAEKLTRLWQSVQGSIFNPSLPPRVVQLVAGRRLHGSDLEEALAEAIREGAWLSDVQNRQTKTIDVQLEFATKVAN
jgi:Surface antigen variable number repeat